MRVLVVDGVVVGGGEESVGRGRGNSKCVHPCRNNPPWSANGPPTFHLAICGRVTIQVVYAW